MQWIRWDSTTTWAVGSFKISHFNIVKKPLLEVIKRVFRQQKNTTKIVRELQLVFKLR